MVHYSRMEFQRTRDYAFIRDTITHPSQYKFAGDDSAPDAADFIPNTDSRIWYVALKPWALFTFIPQNAVCYEVHACVLRGIWGRGSVLALQGAIRWMFEHSPARRVVASIPSYNRLACKLARTGGMVQYGVNPASFLKGGKLHDQYLFGISKGVL